MIINVQVLDDYQQHVPEDWIETAARAALSHMSTVEDSELTVVIQSNEDLRNLNREFRGVDAPTDVLAFPADELDPDSGNRYIGDIAIAYPYAREQAQQAGHPLEHELKLLVVHGVLHLFELDHVEPEDTREMWAAQYSIMDALGIDIRHWPLISGEH